jgi:hypothetical protein
MDCDAAAVQRELLRSDTVAYLERHRVLPVLHRVVERVVCDRPGA